VNIANPNDIFPFIPRVSFLKHFLYKVGFFQDKFLKHVAKKRFEKISFWIENKMFCELPFQQKIT